MGFATHNKDKVCLSVIHLIYNTWCPSLLLSCLKFNYTEISIIIFL